MDQLTISNKLYGRERDIISLLESFERISSGHGEVLLVSGSSGVGKTALVQELQLPIRNRNGFFIRGKFDQYQQNIPYSAIKQALTELCRELQSGSRQQKLRYKADILNALGNLGQVLIDLVPEFELFIGKQPRLEDVSPLEARHRFAEAIQKFFKAICLPEHPVVLFIDDWQWADAASFELLRQLQVEITLHYLLVIVSYRDKEVGSGHPLMFAVDYLRNSDVPVVEHSVRNITPDALNEMLKDILIPAAKDIDGLTAIIHKKTEGNPFFVRSFINYLYEFDLIRFDKFQNCWVWRMDKIKGEDLPDNVVDLFALKFHHLDLNIQNFFSLAACLGVNFDLETLSLITHMNSAECLALLSSEEAKNLILPITNQITKDTSEALIEPPVFKFQHDRIQQAAFALIKPENLPKIRLKIGRALLVSLPSEQLEERLFEVVNNLNAGFNLINERDEQLKVVGLNIKAARKSYAATAYSSAYLYYKAANLFLEKPAFRKFVWDNHHELTMSLFLERAVCEFLEGDRNEAEKCIQESVAHSITPLEKAQALNVLIVQYTLLAKYPKAIELGILALDALGISLPHEDYEKFCIDEIVQVRHGLENRLVSSLSKLPVMSNPEMLMASKILITMGPPCYRSHQRLWSVIVPKVVNLTLRYGNIPQIGYSHTAFGGLLGWIDNDYSTAKEFSELATRLMADRFNSPTDQSVFYLMIGSSNRHWFKHLKYATQDYTNAYEIGLRSGNLQYAAYAFGHNMYCRFYQAVSIDGLIKETERTLEFSRTRLNQWAIDLLEGGLKIFGRLSGERVELIENNDQLEEEFLQRVEDHHNIQVKCIYKVLKTFSFLLMGDYNKALISSDETEPLIYTVGTQGLLPWPEHVFARFLILTALYLKADEDQQKKWNTELDLMMNKFRIWADNCPENFEHKYLLASAELARINGHSIHALKLYDQAIVASQTGNFLQWEGITNERAYGYWLELGNEHIAFRYWQEAYICYKRWGAVAKVNAMETEYRTLIANNLPKSHGSANITESKELEIKNDLVEKQIMQLRYYAGQMDQTRLRIEAETQTAELALATQRLRVEVVERKKIEEELLYQKRFFEQMFTQSSVSTQILDKDGWCERINPKLSQLFGVKPEHIVGKVYNIFKDEGIIQGGVIPYLKKVFNKGETAEWEVYFDIGVASESQNIIVDEKRKVWYQNWAYPIFDEQDKLSHVIIQHNDITQRKQDEEEILKSQELLKEFAFHLQNVREEERILLAREIHDDLAQILIAVKIDMGLIKNKLNKGMENVDQAELMTSFTELSAKVDDTIITTRKIMSGLRSAELELIGLMETLKQEMIDFKEKSKINCLFETELQEINLNAKQSVTLLRIYQEALSNILKHAKATSVKIMLKVENGKLIVVIVDNGLGFDKTKKSRSDSYGMIGMKERVLLLEGELKISSEINQGTSLRIEIPYEN